MSLHQYYQYDQRNSFLEISTGSIKDFDFFNVHSNQHQDDEFHGTKVK